MERTGFYKLIRGMTALSVFVMGIILMCTGGVLLPIGAVCIVASPFIIIIGNLLNRDSFDVDKFIRVIISILVTVFILTIGAIVMDKINWIIGLPIVFAGIISSAFIVANIKGLK